MSQAGRFTVVIATLALLWCASLGIIAYADRQTDQELVAMDRQRIALRDVIIVRESFTAMEAGQRGYLLNGEERHLRQFERGRANYLACLPRMQANVASGYIEPQLAGVIARFGGEILAELEEGIRLRKSGQVPEAVAWERADSARAAKEALAQAIQKRQAEQATRNGVLGRDRRAMDLRRSALIGGILVVNLGFLGWSLWWGRREIVRRLTAVREADDRRDLLKATLMSIGDAVVITDVEKRITLMNDAAVRLSGWLGPQAAGRSWNEVFPLEDPRALFALEGPVSRILRLGDDVSVDGQTVLTRRDGTQVPIVATGAPVRDANGDVRGVVIVLRDFTEHQRAQEELIAANRAKDHFIAALSHELRTPLTPALLQVRALLAREDHDGPTREQLQSVARFIELEARLIDDLLDLTSIARGKVTLRLAVVDFHVLARHVTSMLAAGAAEKSVDLQLSLAASASWIQADATRIQQVLWNVLGNALKFTPAGGRVTVQTQNPEPGRIELSIADTGIGLAAEDLERIFAAFEQVGKEAGKGSLGLGLAISRSIVELHGGSIAASSAGLGKGTVFRIRLQTVPAPASAPLPPVATASCARERVLLVEDHGPTLAIVSLLLEKEGCHVAAATTVAEAIELAGQQPFDVLISDLGLPDGNGCGLLRQLRELGYTFPAIAVSGYGQADDRRTSREAGFGAHLVKPVDIPELREAIAEVLRKG